MILRLKRTPGIYVVGFMGAGKSTVGRHLAHRLGWSFFDTDTEIESAEKTAISEIFASRGEEEFRRIENAVIAQHVRWIERGRPAVLALGGGAFTSPETANCSRTTASQSGWTALSRPSNTVSPRRLTAHWPAIPKPLPPSTPPDGTTTAWPTCMSRWRATTPKSR